MVRESHRRWFFELCDRIVESGRDVLFDSRSSDQDPDPADSGLLSGASSRKSREEHPRVDLIYRPIPGSMGDHPFQAIRVSMTGTIGLMIDVHSRVSVIWQGFWRVAKSRKDIVETIKSDTMVITPYVVSGSADGAPEWLRPALSDLLGIVDGLDTPVDLVWDLEIGEEG